MKVSLKWLSDHVDFSDHSMEQLDALLTFAGIEVEGITNLPDKVIVVEILAAEKIPHTDKLAVCQVNDGTGTKRQIVCGAQNYKVGDKVPLALPGCELGAGTSHATTIKAGKLKGFDSLGMMCGASEIGLEKESTGLLILPADLKPGTPISDVYPAILELEITPNRPDCLSHLGIARELAALVKKELKGLRDHSDSKTTAHEAKKTEIEITSDQCLYYTGRWIRGVKVQDSPAWLKEKLISVGLRPINNIVDITNYVLMDMGQPLHAFDLKKLKGGVIVRQAEAGETFMALDGKEYRLTAEDTVIADSCRKFEIQNSNFEFSPPLAIGGVMGGADSGVTQETTDILLESAYFVPTAVRKTSRTCGIRSDSSYRFERGVDPHQIKGASDFATKLILELAGGKADPELIECGKLPPPPQPVKMTGDFCRKVIGTDIPDAKIDEILTSLGLTKSKKGWEIPSFRGDLERPIDLVEEVARVFGLDHVPSNYAARFAETSKADLAYDFNQKILGKLSSLGFFETRNLKLISQSQLADDRVTNHRGMEVIRLSNPLNDEQDYLRPGLMPGLLASAARNIRFGNSNLRLFEMGKVFTITKKGDEVENEHLALLMTGARVPGSWANNKPENLDIHDLRGALASILGRKSGELVFVTIQDERLLGACSIELGRGKKAVKLGFAGYLPPARARQLDILSPIALAEINLKKLAAALDEDIAFEELPKFPGSSRDIAMLVPLDLPNETIATFFAEYQEPLLVEAKLFDLFRDETGQKLDSSKKSLAYSLLYRSPTRTLESTEVEQAHEKLRKALQKHLPVEFR